MLEQLTTALQQEEKTRIIKERQHPDGSSSHFYATKTETAFTGTYTRLFTNQERETFAPEQRSSKDDIFMHNILFDFNPQDGIFTNFSSSISTFGGEQITFSFPVTNSSGNAIGELSIKNEDAHEHALFQYEQTSEGIIVIPIESDDRFHGNLTSLTLPLDVVQGKYNRLMRETDQVFVEAGILPSQTTVIQKIEKAVEKYQNSLNLQEILPDGSELTFELNVDNNQWQGESKRTDVKTGNQLGKEQVTYDNIYGHDISWKFEEGQVVYFNASVIRRDGLRIRLSALPENPNDPSAVNFTIEYPEFRATESFLIVTSDRVQTIEPIQNEESDTTFSDGFTLDEILGTYNTLNKYILTIFEYAGIFAN